MWLTLPNGMSLNSGFCLKRKGHTLSLPISPFFLPGVQAWWQAIVDHADDSSTERSCSNNVEAEGEAPDEPESFCVLTKWKTLLFCVLSHCYFRSLSHAVKPILQQIHVMLPHRWRAGGRGNGTEIESWEKLLDLVTGCRRQEGRRCGMRPLRTFTWRLGEVIKEEREYRGN